MKASQTKFFIIVSVILLTLGYSYYFREDAMRLFRELQNKLQPCQNPITYSIVNLDPRFDLTEEELLDSIKQAEEIWESSIGKQLFEYSPTGDLKISFVYDYRQKATDAMEKIGIVFNDDQSTYDALKAKYNSLIALYNKEKAQIEPLVRAYNAEKSVLEKDIDYWNSRGGAPKAEYRILEQRRADLNNQVEVINQAENYLNELVDTINSTEIVLNKLIATLNLQVNRYNTVVSSTGKEFNEGEYIRDASGTVINVFQFNDENQLVRVLAHELGHAMGLEHIDNPKAIMYYLNEGMNQKLTADDLAVLKQVCEIK